MQLSIVVPCYNEEEVLQETAGRLVRLLTDLQVKGKISYTSRIYFVDDGSRDRTWPIIEKLSRELKPVHGIKLSRNQGHQNALMAGMSVAEGDAVVSIDADLQDDIQVIEKMVDAHREGFDVVYGVRDNRDTDSFFKQFTAESYYRLLRIMGVEAIFNHADFRLLSKNAIEALHKFQETNLFLRGIIPLIGFPSTTIGYRRTKRLAGETKYPTRKMFGLALEGITSFSSIPLRFITFLGRFVFVISGFLGLWALWLALFTSKTVPGWTSMVVPVYFIGGIQLFCIGVIGEYIAKIYLEVKARPRFIIEKQL